MSFRKPKPARRQKPPQATPEDVAKEQSLTKALFGSSEIIGRVRKERKQKRSAADAPDLDSQQAPVTAKRKKKTTNSADKAGPDPSASTKPSDDFLPLASDSQQQEEGEQQEQDDISPAASSSSSSSSFLPSAWTDADDASLSVSVEKYRSASRLRKLRKETDETQLSGEDFVHRLREQHAKLAPAGSLAWAAQAPQKTKKKEEENDEEEDDEEDTSFLRSTASLLDTKNNNSNSKPLAQTRIEILRVRDVTNEAIHQQQQQKFVQHQKKNTNKSFQLASIEALEFHPSAPLLFTAALDRSLRLYSVNARSGHELVQGVHYGDLPLTSAFFFPDGEEILCSGLGRHFYSLHLHEGTVLRVPGFRGTHTDDHLTTAAVSKHGTSSSSSAAGNETLWAAIGSKSGSIFVSSQKSKQLLWTIRAPEPQAAISFHGNQLYSTGRDGKVYVFDIRANHHRCLHAAVDEGALHNSAINLSPNGRYVTTGGSSGVVNVYEREQLLASEKPKPIRSLMNLQTAIRGLEFNHDSQLLCAYSHREKDSLRLVHLPSVNVFSNWPTQRSPLHYVERCGFSPHSGYLAIGNAKGAVLLYRLAHYSAL